MFVRTALALLLVAIVVLVALVPASLAIYVGDEIPRDRLAVSYTGQQTYLNQHISEGLAVVEFISTTCGHCAAMQPFMRQAWDEYKEVIRFVGVFFLANETFEAMQAFTIEHSAGWLHLLAPPETEVDWGILYTPSVFFISNGVVVGAKAGAYSDYSELAQDIGDLLTKADVEPPAPDPPLLRYLGKQKVTQGYDLVFEARSNRTGDILDGVPLQILQGGGILQNDGPIVTGTDGRALWRIRPQAPLGEVSLVVEVHNDDFFDRLTLVLDISEEPPAESKETPWLLPTLLMVMLIGTLAVLLGRLRQR